MMRPNAKKITLCFYSHISTDTVRDIVVTWSTELKSRTSICKYGRRHVEVAEENKDGPTLFIDQGVARRRQFIHRVSNKCECLLI